MPSCVSRHVTATGIRISRQSRGRLSSATRRCLSATSNTVTAGDIVILKRSTKSRTSTFLTKPLKAGDEVHTHYGAIKHSDIIGKNVRDLVLASTGQSARIHVPTLAEYVTETPRSVTPIYPGDANLIVSLLDIHVSAPTPETADDPPLEILEAGTGHGGLTLHLARAVHAANAHLAASDIPPSSSLQPRPAPDGPQTQMGEQETPDPRRAIVHTLDIQRATSASAAKLVRRFRHGMYAPSIAFHAGQDVSAFIAAQQALRLRRHRRAAEPTNASAVTAEARAGAEAEPGAGAAGQLFHHILLDLPGAHAHLRAAASALRDDGLLVVFCPSVTQVAECVAAVRRRGLPLALDRVLELGPGLSGGRAWDVRAVRARKPGAGPGGSPSGGGAGGRVRGQGAGAEEPLLVKLRRWLIQMLQNGLPKRARDGAPLVANDGEAGEVGGDFDGDMDADWHIACRPSVGHRVVGGGFVGLWRRKRGWEPAAPDEEQGARGRGGGDGERDSWG